MLKLLGEVSEDFKLEDIDVKLPRNKHDNIQSKAQSFGTLVGTGVIAPEDALAMADMTNDITGVVDRGKKFQEENKENGNVGIKSSVVYHSGYRRNDRNYYGLNDEV